MVNKRFTYILEIFNNIRNYYCIMKLNNRGEDYISYQKITIAGCGLLGSQIAMQAAYCGLDVTVWLRTMKKKKTVRILTVLSLHF